jgi:hypothetical protein
MVSNSSIDAGGYIALMNAISERTQRSVADERSEIRQKVQTINQMSTVQPPELRVMRHAVQQKIAQIAIRWQWHCRSVIDKPEAPIHSPLGS